MRAIFHRRDVERAVQPAERDERAGDEAELDDLRIGELVPHAGHEGFIHRVVRNRHPFGEVKGRALPGRPLRCVG